MVSTRINRTGRVPLLIMGMACLVAGVWGGLVRLPLNLPLPGGNANWLTFHGPLMVCGFLGTVIGLERAVGLRGAWSYGAPLLTGIGALMFVGGVMSRLPLLLMTAGSLWFWLVTVRVVKMQPVLFTAVMSAGAFTWAIGNVFWCLGWSFNRIVPWWIAFLALTILGERLDLSRFQKQTQWTRPLFFSAVFLFMAGVILTAFNQVPGERLTGLGLLSLTAWLGRFDLARRTIKQPGLARFMAVCLLVGYAWLATAGILMLIYSPLESGLHYDAPLHAFFLGFVFSMIFGHAPVIFPAVLALQPAFRRSFYSHVIVLHFAVLLRVAGDVAKLAPVRQWGGILGAVAIALFIVNTVTSFVFRPSSKIHPARFPQTAPHGS